MKRATLLLFRDPREKTPDAQLITLTNTGDRLLSFNRKHSAATCNREQRFIQFDKSKVTPGPGSYNTLTAGKSPNYIISKSVLKNEHHYEYVGLTKVLNTQWMKQSERKLHNKKLLSFQENLSFHSKRISTNEMLIHQLQHKQIKQKRQSNVQVNSKTIIAQPQLLNNQEY